MATKALIDGRPILGTVPFVWEFRPGTSPTTAFADVTPGDADALTAGGMKPLKLEIGDGQTTTLIQQVYCIHRLPGANENLSRILLADRRWFWNRIHIKQTFNLRRHIGVKRLVSRGSPPVAFPVTDDIQYAPWTLNNGVAWRAEDAIREIMRRIVAKEAKLSGSSAGFTFDGGQALLSVPFEGLQLDDSGDQALARLLAYMPDFNVTVDANGEARIYGRTDTGEVAVLENLGAEKVGGGHIELVSLARIRPKEIHVLFTPECELKFKFSETDPGATVADAGDGLIAENVLPVPDFALGDWVLGTWVRISQAISAWGPVPVFGALTGAKLRRGMCPFMDLWGPMRFAGDLVPASDWGARISAVITHWRRTFRINRKWMDRIARLNAYAVATIDQETGTRGPAMVWSDWCVVAGTRMMLQDIVGRRDVVYAQNYANYPAGDLIVNANAAPCKVRIADHDQGIVGLHWLMDEYRLQEMIIPGQISNNPSPRFDGDKIAFNALSRTFGADAAPQMAAGYKAMILLSAVPAVPNDETQLYRVVVKPNEVDAVKDLGPFDGPIMEVRIHPGLETARIAWLDSRENDIKTLFGILPGTPNIDDLVINDQPGRGGQAGSLNEISKAAAARIWAGFADRQQGQARFGQVLAPLAGMIDRVALEVSPTGEVSTTVETGRQAPKISMFSLMPADVRAFVMKLAQAGK